MSTPLNTTGRIEWIDTAKGMAVLLVVVGHFLIDNTNVALRFINSFHMPLFFLLSGIFVVGKSDSEDFSTHLKKRFNRIMVPYFVYGICVIIPFRWLYFHFIIPDSQIDFPQRVLAHILGLSSDHGIQWRGELWFLPCLFMADMILWSIWHYAYRYRFLTLCAVVVLGLVYHFTCGQSLPLRAHTAMLAVIFLTIGIYLKNSRLSGKTLLMLVLTCGICWILCGYPYVDMHDADYGRMYITLPLAAGMSISVAEITRRMKPVRLLSLLGRQTLAVYILQTLALPFYTALSQRLHIIDSQWLNVAVSLPAAFVTAVCCAYAGQWLQRKLPWSFGIFNKNAGQAVTEA